MTQVQEMVDYLPGIIDAFVPAKSQESTNCRPRSPKPRSPGTKIAMKSFCQRDNNIDMPTSKKRVCSEFPS